MVYFATRTISRATDRQSPSDGLGVKCARCGRRLVGENWRYYAIPRIPKELGGRGTIDNCVILCFKCYLEVGQNNTEVIPYEELPFFRV